MLIRAKLLYDLISGVVKCSFNRLVFVFLSLYFFCRKTYFENRFLNLIYVNVNDFVTLIYLIANRSYFFWPHKARFEYKMN